MTPQTPSPDSTAVVSAEDFVGGLILDYDIQNLSYPDGKKELILEIEKRDNLLRQKTIDDVLEVIDTQKYRGITIWDIDYVIDAELNPPRRKETI
jgi:hypothetical protein